ncbi:MAG: glycosyltransferase family 4 protein [Deltaproteobacteria bacterium]|nr:glycosyltransferase family 4 protein [Deltaproteobacteria bacterium]MBW2075237.1 glycosyltransferase family 4 protein [Deltaproteobacteria bacterium]
MLKVLHTEWSKGWGGQEIRILLDAKGLIDRGHEVGILCSPESRLATEGQKNGIRTYFLDIRHSLDGNALWKIIKLFKEKDITVVNTHSSVDSWIASFAAKIANVPVLVRTRHLSVPIPKHFLNFVYRMPDAIVTTGESIRRMMIEENHLNGEKIFSIPTGVMLNRFRPEISGATIRQELQIEKGTKVVTMVAVLRSWKRHDVFLEAAMGVLSVMPSTVFWVVGDGPGFNNIQRKIEQLEIGKNVIMTGYREDIPEILAASDVCVLTSESAEGVPQAVLQYLAMKKPVVATNAGSISEVIKPEETGLLVEPNNAEAVARGILRLLKDEKLSRILGENGRSVVEKYYDYENMLDRTIELYRSIYRRKIG